MLLKENILLALAGLKANKMRSFLTMLGIIIGIASVIAIMTVGDAVNNSVTSSMGDIGANNIELYLGYRDDLDFSQDLPAMEGKDCISTDMIEEMLKKYSDESKPFPYRFLSVTEKPQKEKIMPMSVSLVQIPDFYWIKN